METPLKDFHAQRGATFSKGEGAGRLVSYAPFDEAYGALESGCGLFDLSDEGRIELRGDDRVRFLNGMVTNDVAKLRDGMGFRACMLNRQSRILADLHVFALPGAFLLAMEPELKAKVAERLEKYRMGLAVEVGEPSCGAVLLSLQGPGAPGIALDVLSADVSDLPAFGHREAGTGRVFRVNRTGRPGFDVLLPAGSAEAFWLACLASGAVPAGWDVLEAARIEAGLPRYGADLSEKVLFSEGDVPAAVSYRKGCYVGQEIVARVKTYGRLNRSRRGLLVSGRANPGDAVLDGGKPVAQLTSARFSPLLQKTAAFAYLKTAVEDGSTLAVRSGDGELEAVVAPYPFV